MKTRIEFEIKGQIVQLPAVLAHKIAGTRLYRIAQTRNQEAAVGDRKANSRTGEK